MKNLMHNIGTIWRTFKGLIDLIDLLDELATWF